MTTTGTTPAGFTGTLLRPGDAPDRVRAAYRLGTWRRLVELKRRYDPDNVFRRNGNVPPSG